MEPTTWPGTQRNGVPESIFKIYRSLYVYDKSPLNAVVNQSWRCVWRNTVPKDLPAKVTPDWTRPVTVTCAPFPGTPNPSLRTQIRPVPSSTSKAPSFSTPNDSVAWPEMVTSFPAYRPGSRLMSPILVDSQPTRKIMTNTDN